MTVLVVASAKGSPGVTTTALLLAAACDRSALLVEGDESGGSLGARFGLGDEPGLRTLAVRARRSVDATAIGEHTQRIGEVDVVVGPPTADEARAVLSSVAGWLVDAVVSTDRTVIVDVGRCGPSSPSWPLACNATCCFVVCRPRLDEYRPAAALAAELRASGQRVSFVCIGSTPYSPVEFAEEASVDLFGVLPDDPQGGAALRGEPVGERALRRSGLWRVGVTLADKVVSLETSDEGAGAPLVGVQA